MRKRVDKGGENDNQTMAEDEVQRVDKGGENDNQTMAEDEVQRVDKGGENDNQTMAEDEVQNPLFSLSAFLPFSSFSAIFPVIL